MFTININDKSLHRRISCFLEFVLCSYQRSFERLCTSEDRSEEKELFGREQQKTGKHDPHDSVVKKQNQIVLTEI